LELTPEEVETEYWAHFYANSPEGEEYEDEDLDVTSLAQNLGENDWEDLIND